MRISVVKDFSPSRLMPQMIGEAIAQHAVRDPHRPAIVGTQFAPFSFRGLDLWIKEIGEHLRAAGIGPQSRIGIMLPPGPEGAVLSVAIACHAISVPLNSNRPESEIEEELARTRLDALVLPSWVDSPALAIAQRTSFGLIEASRAAGPLSSVALRQVRATPVLTRSPVHPALDSIALIFTTSGTTGTARVVPVTHENLLVTADKMRHWFNLSSDDRTAFVLPGYYGAAIKISLLAPLLLGGSVGLPNSRHVQDLVEWIPDLCPTWLWGNPTFFQAVLDRLRSRAGIKLMHSLRFVVSGTAYLPPTLRAELEETLGVPVLQSYGMSEAGILAADPAPPFKRKPGTVGLISREELTIVDPKGDPLPDGEVGEIVVHGPTVSPDIGTDAEAEGQHSNDRWLFTGDLGSIDSEGYLTVIGRTKELINRGGEKISPYEVERALLLHPSVQEAAAFSVPHPRLGENVAAAVVLKQGTNPSTLNIKTFLADHLAPFKIPQHVFVVPRLLKGATGKVSRSELSEAMAQRIRDVAPPETALETLIRDIWQTLLRRDDVGIEDDFFELGGDSLLAVQMMLEVEAITRRTIPLSAIICAPTIAQLAELMQQEGTLGTSESLVPFRLSGGNEPLYIMHDRHGSLFVYRHLLPDLNTNRPVYGLQPPPLDRAHRILRTIESMATSYIAEIRRIQPRGPYFLMGYSFGGWIVFEMAQQLTQEGERVNFLGMIDTVNPPVSSRAVRLRDGITGLRGQQIPLYLLLRVCKSLAFRMRARKRSAVLWLNALRRLFKRTMSDTQRSDYYEWLCLRARRQYVPRPYSGHLTIFSSAGNSEWQRLCWKPLVQGRLTVLEVPAGHHKMIRPPHSKVLAEKIDDALRADPGSWNS